MIDNRQTPPSLWRNFNFVLLWSGQGVSALGSSFTELALPMLVLAMSGSPAQAGFVTAVGTAPNLLFSLLAGALVDRWNRKLVMIVCDLTRLLALGSVPLAYALGHLSLGQLYLVAAIQGTCFVFFGLAVFSCLPHVVDRKQIAKASGLNQLAESGAVLVGPGLAGSIINLARTPITGAALALLADSISYLVSVISLLFIRIPFQAERGNEAAGPLLAQIGEGMRFLWSKPGLRTMLFATMSIFLLTGPLYVGIIMLAASMSANAFEIGLIFSGASVGGITGALVAPWLQERLGHSKLVIVAVVVPALLLPVIATAGSPWVIALGWAIIDVTVPFFNIAQVSYRFSVVPDAIQGRVGSVFRAGGFGAAILGTSLGGVLLDHFGPRPVFLIMAGGMTLTAAVLSLIAIRQASGVAKPVLRGSLRGIPPAAVLRMIMELGRTGTLRVSYRRFRGGVYVSDGHVVAARLGAEHGMAALEGLAVALPDGEFLFEDDATPDVEDDALLELDLLAYLDELDHERRYITSLMPSLELVPRLVGAGPLGQAGMQVTLDGSVLRLLPSVARGLTLEAMALECGLVDTVRAVTRMVQLGLATIPPADSRHRRLAPVLGLFVADEPGADSASASG